MWLHREAVWCALVGMLIPVVEPHWSCCLDPSGVSQKEPHSRVQAVQHYLQSMEESWKNVFLIKKKKKLFCFFLPLKWPKSKELGYFSCNFSSETQNNCCHSKGSEKRQEISQELTVDGQMGRSKALVSHVLWLLWELPPCNPVPFFWMATPHYQAQEFPGIAPYLWSLQ